MLMKKQNTYKGFNKDWMCSKENNSEHWKGTDKQKWPGNLNKTHELQLENAKRFGWNMKDVFQEIEGTTKSTE